MTSMLSSADVHEPSESMMLHTEQAFSERVSSCASRALKGGTDYDSWAEKWSSDHGRFYWWDTTANEPSSWTLQRDSQQMIRRMGVGGEYRQGPSSTTRMYVP